MYVVADDAVREAVAALPAELLPAMAELRTALELAPWSVGTPLVPSNPRGLRVVGFGERERAQLVYGVVDRDRLVSLLQLSWV
ncbi:hypothetical protein Acsp07_26420 [Actinomycetospora sp. NBRC 106378]|nr:hypothetical protein Acsp07_26420 [Actinomycetospora sp. NBRC 106378]